MIEFTNTLDQGVSFGTLAAVQNLNTMSITYWIYQDTRVSNAVVMYLDNATASDENWIVWLNTGAAGQVEFQALWSGSNGIWRTGDVLTAAQWDHVVITYDNSSTANVPVIYVNGSSVAVATIASPSGTYVSGTSNTFYVGASNTGVYSPIDGKEASVAIYDRILSASEVSDAYSARLAIPTYNGLVFAPMLWGASGGVEDGDTLGSTNKVVDAVAGAQGTPNNSPVFRADDYLTIA